MDVRIVNEWNKKTGPLLWRNSPPLCGSYLTRSGKESPYAWAGPGCSIRQRLALLVVRFAQSEAEQLLAGCFHA